jgi:hypothetical protein
MGRQEGIENAQLATPAGRAQSLETYSLLGGLKGTLRRCAPLTPPALRVTGKDLGADEHNDRFTLLTTTGLLMEGSA